MPETAIHKHRQLELGENKVRPDLKPDTGNLKPDLHLPPPARDTLRPHQPEQRDFRLLVAAPADAGHDLGAFGLGEDVRHWLANLENKYGRRRLTHAY